MSGAIRRQRAGQVILDLGIGSSILLAKLHADTRGTITLGTSWRHPHHPP